jgi:single-strand DNA-binding protein
MANLNKVFMMGNLTRDPELKFTPQGKAVCSFPMAVNRQFKSGDDLKKEVNFFPVVSWGALAENINKYLKKGSPVFVEGRLQNRSYETKEGQKRTVTEIITDNVQFLSSGNRQEPGEQQHTPAETAEAQEYFSGDEVPF